MYLPIIVAMAATRNVKAAISGGPVAIVAGVIVTIAAFFLVPLIAKIGREKSEE
jgi:malonate transporter MadL subunit